MAPFPLQLCSGVLWTCFAFRILWSEAFYGSISTTIGVVGSFGLVSRSGFYGPRPFMAPFLLQLV